MPEKPDPALDVSMLTHDILLRLAHGLLSSGVALALFRPDDTLHYATSGFREIYNVQPGPQTFSSVMRHCWETGAGPLIETQDIDGWLAMANARRRSVPNRQFEVDISDSRWMWVSETTLPDNWVVLTITDFTTVKTREFRLKSDRDAAIAAAETDHLTGLFNRKGVMSRFDRLIERARATNEVFSVVLIDLDHFKRVNDQFGHDSGDQVLVHFATCAAQVLRERDIFGRVGGEEFLILMPGASAQQAFTVLERMQAHLRDQRLSFDGVTLRYTFSAGIAQGERGKTPDTLYHEADRALYLAKGEGRDQVRQAG